VCDRTGDPGDQAAISDQQSDFRLSFLVDDSVRTTGTKIDQPPAQPQQSPPPADKGIAIPAAVLR
jgi:hypothetical protein